ncbi:MAG: HepT-like ribonuclease domain-containing protein [Dehalococcoidia bacterium]|jgi:uncharacterized protein with HEPN domain
MPPPDDYSALVDVRHYCRLILTATGDLGGPWSDSDVLLQSAVERWRTIIGEAVKRLTMGYRELHPEVPWRGWAGLRDVLAHAYDEINPEELWRISTSDVRRLLDAVESLLGEFPDAPL